MELKVNAVVAVERTMTEDRMMRLESDVGELKGDVEVLNARVGEWIIASAKESGDLRADVERGFGWLRAEMEKGRVDTEKSLGTLRTSIESAKLWMLVTGVGSVILVTFVTFLGRALKLF